MKIKLGKTYIDFYHNKFRIVSLGGLKGQEAVGVCDAEAILRSFALDGVSDYEAQNLVSEFDPWTEVKVDTPIWVRDRTGDSWIPRHFVKYENGEVYAWADGGTQHTASIKQDPCTKWRHATLENPDLLKGEPKC